jgi:hypothetical protein
MAGGAHILAPSLIEGTMWKKIPENMLIILFF